MDSIIERQANRSGENVNDTMLNLEFIGKSVIGILGTTFTVLVEQLSGVVALAAGIATLWYMIAQAVNATKRGKREKIIFEQKQEEMNNEEK